MKRETLFDGTEIVPGYARAVKVGNHVYISGTTSLNGKGEVVGDSAYAQTKEITRKFDAILAKAGASRKHIVRLKLFATDPADMEGIVRAMSEDYEGIDPASALIGIAWLARPGLKIEIEADALISDD
jgi:enamine deaminase RidA (YjgF/YER057c/UK114 family)